MGHRWAPTPQASTHSPRPPPTSSLCVQVRPSQPSRQMQEKESPLPTQVPPFTQGLGRQLLFSAAKKKKKRTFSSDLGRHEASTHVPDRAMPGRAGSGARGGARSRPRGGAKAQRAPEPCLLTYVAGAALPARGAGTAEGVPAVIARATVATGVGIALELACGHTGRSVGVPRAAGRPQRGRGPAGTHASGRSCPSSRHHRRNRSR